MWTMENNYKAIKISYLRIRDSNAPQNCTFSCTIIDFSYSWREESNETADEN